MLNNFIFAKKKSLFTSELEKGNILDEAIVFIEDTKLIWNHGTYFDCTSIDLSEYYTKQEIDNKENNTLNNITNLIDDLNKDINKVHEKFEEIPEYLLDLIVEEGFVTSEDIYENIDNMVLPVVTTDGTVTRVRAVTQLEYDTLGDIDPTTLYIIKDE